MPYRNNLTTDRAVRSFAMVIVLGSVGLSTRPTVRPQNTPSRYSAQGLAPQPGLAYAGILGPSSIDDGLAEASDPGRAMTNALSTVTDLFGASEKPGNATGQVSSAVSAARDLDAAIPESEYDLVQLAKSLPDDPDALYRFVTDRIRLDGYDGVLRGPLVTWMSRAGGPTDKTALLAWLFVTKNIPYEFVRGSLSAEERIQIANAAAARAPEATVDPRVAGYVNALGNDGAAFANWARGVLSARKVQFGDGQAPQDRLRTRHYWLRVSRNGALVNLDPTLPGSRPGTHLGTIDPSFRATAVLPRDEWHYLRIQVIASFSNHTSKTLIDHTDAVSDVAYAPIRLVFAPSGSGDLMQPGAATAFDVGLQIGSKATARSHIDLGRDPTAVQSVVLEVRRTAPDQAIIEVARRSFIDERTPAADQPFRLAGMTTIIVATGRGANAFTTHMQFHALQQLARDAAAARAGAVPPPHPWYPIRIVDYYRRDDAIADAVSSQGARLYRDRPNGTMLRTSFSHSASGATPVIRFDIADNGMSSTATDRNVVVRENMMRGYADTKIEHDVLEGPGGGGTIALFAIAKAHNVSASVVTTPPQPSDGLHDGLDRTLAAGQIAIAPSAPVNANGRALYGWWAIDPKTGNTVGRMSGGAGQDLAEESVTINTISRAYTLYGQLETGAQCIKSGFGSLGCWASACASIASYVFGGGTIPGLASNWAAGQLATAGCRAGFGVK